jgi:hypothetical protein
MALGRIKHSRSKVSKAFWRGKPRGQFAKVHVEVSIGRGEKVKWLGPGVPRVMKGHGLFTARACVGTKYRSPKSATGHRCVNVEGSTPTKALRVALRKLSSKIR